MMSVRFDLRAILIASLLLGGACGEEEAEPQNPDEEEEKDSGSDEDEDNEEETGKKDAGKADAGKADAGKADGGKPDAGKPDAGKPDAGKGGDDEDIDAGSDEEEEPVIDAGKPDAGGSKPDAGGGSTPDAGGSKPDAGGGSKPDAGGGTPGATCEKIPELVQDKCNDCHGGSGSVTKLGTIPLAKMNAVSAVAAVKADRMPLGEKLNAQDKAAVIQFFECLSK